MGGSGSDSGGNSSGSRSLVYWPHPALRVKCAPVDLAREISEEVDSSITMRDDVYRPHNVDWNVFGDGEHLRCLIDDMMVAMKQHGGIGLAANQVGEVDSSVLLVASDCEGGGSDDVVVLMNPEILSTSEECARHQEGCLSFPGQRVGVSRPKYVTLRYLSVYGRYVVSHVTGILAVCAQHEIDHLNGKAIIDHADPFTRDAITRKMKNIRAS